MPIVLVVDDSEVDRRLIGGLLAKDIDWLVEYAKNGRDALERIEDTMPDLVVTDLRMPDMDGIELVDEVNRGYPDLPVILATAHGSEELAVEALKRGAASYVPKTELAAQLVETAEQVLGIAAHQRESSRLDERVVRHHVVYHLDSDPQLIAPLVDRVRTTLLDLGLCNRSQQMHVGVALEEALLNSLYHGNLQLPVEQWRADCAELRKGILTEFVKNRREEAPYNERIIVVDVSICPKEIRFQIEDQGGGFDLAAVPEPGDPSTLQEHVGRGLVLMKNFVDQVRFNDRGNEVTMTIRPKSGRCQEDPS